MFSGPRARTVTSKPSPLHRQRWKVFYVRTIATSRLLDVKHCSTAQSQYVEDVRILEISSADLEQSQGVQHTQLPAFWITRQFRLLESARLQLEQRGQECLEFLRGSTRVLPASSNLFKNSSSRSLFAIRSVQLLAIWSRKSLLLSKLTSSAVGWNSAFKCASVAQKVFRPLSVVDSSPLSCSRIIVSDLSAKAVSSVAVVAAVVLDFGFEDGVITPSIISTVPSFIVE